MQRQRGPDHPSEFRHQSFEPDDGPNTVTIAPKGEFGTECATEWISSEWFASLEEIR